MTAHPLTIDGKHVMSGATLYRMRNTNGLPLEISIDRVRDRGCEIDWTAYVRAAIADGRLHAQAYDEIKAGLAESFQPEGYGSAVLAGVQRYIERDLSGGIRV